MAFLAIKDLFDLISFISTNGNSKDNSNSLATLSEIKIL